MMSHLEKNQQLLRERAAVSVSRMNTGRESYLIADAMIYASELHIYLICAW